MGFVEGLQAGSNIVFNRDKINLAQQDENRAEKQQRLTALSQGYTQDDSGQWVPTDLKQQQQNTQKSKLDLVQQQLNATQQELKSQQSYQFANSMAGLTNSWVNGDFEDAYKYAHQTPGFMDKLRNAPSLDFNDFGQINFSNPNDVQKLKDLGIDTTKLTDKQAQDALQSSLMKIQGKDGKDRIVPIDSIINQTNSYSHYTKAQRDSYDAKLGFINDTLKGLTIQEQDAKNEKNKLAAASVQKQSEDKVTYFKNNPDKTYTDYLNSQKPANLNEVQAQDFLDWKKIPGNEDKTYTEYKSTGLPDKTIRRDTLKQLTEARDRVNKTRKAYEANPNSDTLQAYKDATAINTRLNAGQAQVRENLDVNDSISAKTIAKDITKYTPKQRTNAEEQFIVSKNYDPYKKQHQQFLQDVVAVKNTERLKKQLDTLVANGNYKSNFFVNLSNTIKKYTPSDWKRLSTQDVDKIALEAKVDKNTAAILKTMSGTAASDQEFARTLGYTIGQMNYDEKTKQVIFNSSYEKLRNDTIQQGKQLVNSGLVGKTYDELKSIEPTDTKTNNTNLPKEGDIVQGYKFLGGDASDKNNWQEIK